MSPSSGPLPESMKAVRVHAYDGRPESIRVENVRVEKPGRGQVTIRVAAAPINPSDLMFLRGRYGLTKPTPAIPGFEGAGIVVSAGPDLYWRWLLGKRVACGTEPEGGGTWAEYVTTSTRLCMPLPARVSDEEGAMAMANPVTAIALLHEAKDRGHKAAVHTAAAGALGRILFRVASKDRFPVIHVVRREEQVRLLKELGDAEKDLLEFQTSQVSAGLIDNPINAINLGLAENNLAEVKARYNGQDASELAQNGQIVRGILGQVPSTAAYDADRPIANHDDVQLIY